MFYAVVDPVALRVWWVSGKLGVDRRGWLCCTIELQPHVMGSVIFTAVPSPGENLIEGTHFHWCTKMATDINLVDKKDTYIKLARRTGRGEAMIPLLLEHMVFLGFDPLRTSTWTKIYSMESMIYNNLLRRGVDIAFHHIIFRRFCDHLGDLRPVEESEFNTWVEEDLTRLRTLYQMELHTLDDKRLFVKFTRPRLGKIMPKRWLEEMKTSERQVGDISDAEMMALDMPGDSDAGAGVEEWGTSSLEELIMTLNARIRIPKSGAVYRVTLRRINFGQLVDYCVGDGSTDLTHVGLPIRDTLPHVPILLMDDSAKHLGVFQYIISDYKSLGELEPCPISEVFLEGQIVTVVNFDIDRKFTGLLDPMGELDRIGETFVTFLHQAVKEFFKFDNVVKKRIGEVAVFIRREALPGKFSARFTWFPAYELCFMDIKEVADFTEVLQEIVMREDSFFTYTTTDATTNVERRLCAIDAQPFCKNKSCRLPNATKIEDGVFSGQFLYIKSFNVIVKSERDYRKANIGISRAPVGFDRPSLGPQYIFGAISRFSGDETVYSSRCEQTITVEKDRVEAAIKLLSTTWGPVKIAPTQSGSVRLLPTDKNSRFCFVHNRLHTKAGVSIVVTNRYIYPKCFHPDPPAHTIPPGSFLHIANVNGKPVARIGSGGGQ
ncbi:helicase-primase primase subunit [Silurid herpesvirus 1]|nr:helicase-primase primase subunit [Silurid herpesvirus 1]